MRLFGDDTPAIDDPFLQRAYHLAEEGRGSTAPNPVVGCVVVSDGRIVGSGSHLSYGGPHAEVMALGEAGDAARGSTVYVTLEPCNHHGKTPPCTDALIRAGVSSVMIGMRDPNASVTGGGSDALASAGVEVSFAQDSTPYVEQNEAWMHFLRTTRPWVRAKTALSLDAKTTLRDGVRSTMSGPASIDLTMKLRAMSDAVLVGARTAEIDQPELTVRDESGQRAEKQPIRILLARNALPNASFLTDGYSRSIALLPQEWTDSGHGEVEVLGYDSSAGVLGALETLGSIGITSLFVEAGGGLMTALWELNLIDELVLYHSGGMAGASAPGMYYRAIEDSTSVLPRRLSATETSVIDGDVVSVWRRFKETKA